MGVHVILDIDPRGIDELAWATVYDETLALLSAWQPRLLGWGWRSIEGVRVPMFLRSICSDAGPKKAGWSIVGDRDSLQTAECQSLFRKLSRYARRCTQPTTDDIVVAAALPGNECTSGPVQVFGDKTQGHPYHLAVLSAAMLVEERFPRHAMVWGDIDRGQAEQARRMAAPILGRELPLPVRVDAPRLVERLRARYDAGALPGAFERVFLGEADEKHEAVLRAFPGQEGARQWLRTLAEYKSLRSLGAIRLVIAWLNSGRDLREACRLACLAPEGPRFSAEEFVGALASTWIAIARPARDPLDVFQKPPGASHTVASMFGSFLLDMEAMGRHLRVHIEPAAIVASLSEVFGDQGAALATRLLEKSATMEKQLRERADDVNSLVARAAEQAGDDTEALATIRSADTMGPNQRIWVRATAWSVMQVLASLRDGDPKIRATLASAEKAKHMLVRILSEHSPVLTEDAWDVILAESDTEILAWQVALASMRAHELHLSQVHRAFFENAEIRRYAIAIGHDEREMGEIGELMAKARADKVKAGSASKRP